LIVAAYIGRSNAEWSIVSTVIRPLLSAAIASSVQPIA
jgi:hypothetical protein